jgi:CBS domain-containing protein
MTIQRCMKRNVFSIHTTATLRQAAALFADKQFGTLPVLDDAGRPVGVLSMSDLLSLSLPSFLRLMEDVDFVHDFGAVEAITPAAPILDQPVTAYMRPVFAVEQNCGLLRAYALMLQHNLHDLPVLDQDGRLAGIASRVDIGSSVLRSWERSP